MPNPHITTLGDLLQNGYQIDQLANLVSINGVYFNDRFGAWKAALPSGNCASQIDSAKNALAEYYQINNFGSEGEHKDYWQRPDQQNIEQFGFQLDQGTNELTVENTPVQGLQEKIVELSQKIIELESGKSPLKIDETRAIAVRLWLYSNDALSRLELWDTFHKADPIVFPKKQDNRAIKKAMDRVHEAYHERYKEKINYPE